MILINIHLATNEMLPSTKDSNMAATQIVLVDTHRSRFFSKMEKCRSKKLHLGNEYFVINIY